MVFDYDEAGKILSNLFFVGVEYRNKKGELVSGVIFMPTRDELAKIESFNDYQINGIIHGIITEKAKFDIENKAMEIYGTRINLTWKGLLALMTRFGREKEARKAATDKLRPVIEKAGFKISAEDIFDVILTPTEKVLNEYFWDLEITDLKVRTMMDLSEYKMLFRLIAKTRNARYEFKDSGSMDKVDDILSRLMYTASYHIRKLDSILGHIGNLARDRGYNVVADTPYLNEIYRIILEKTHAEAGIRITLTGQKTEKEVENRVQVSVVADKGRLRIPVDVVARRLADADVTKGEVSVYGKTISYNSTYSLEEAEDALLQAEKVAEVIREIIEEYKALKEERRKEVTLTTESIVALYLAKEIGLSPVNVEALIGRQEGILYTTVARVLKKLDPEAYGEIKKRAEFWGDRSVIKSRRYDVLRVLTEKGYVTLTKKGDVLINGKEMTKLLMSVGFPFTAAKDLETSVFGEILRWSEVYTDEKLDKEGYYTPEFVSKMIQVGARVPLEAAMKVWDDIPGPLKLYYLIENTRAIEEIIRNPEFRAKTKPFHGILVEKILKQGNVGLATALAAVTDPSIVGTDKYEVVAISDSYAVDLGKHLVVLYARTGDGDTYFLVADKDKKKGILVKADNMAEAVELAEMQWSEVLEELDFLRRLSKSEKSVRVEEIEFWWLRGYKIPMVLLFRDLRVPEDIPHDMVLGSVAIPAFKGISKVVMQAVEERKREEERIRRGLEEYA